MKDSVHELNRRELLKTISKAGMASILLSTKAISEENSADAKKQKDEFPQVPKRKLGRTGVEVPCLSLGTNRLTEDNQVILRSSMRWGVSYWDTANSYSGGNSELCIGKFILKDPDIRKDLFIVTKASRAETIDDVEKRLQTSLERMNTKYIDLYYGIHGCSSPGQFTEELRQWVLQAKKRKVIRFFGFSTHKNMAQCLTAAVKLDWIDAIMTSYNFRLMQSPEMQDAVEACHKAGVGLIAMKTTGQRIGRGPQVETEADKKMIAHFLQRGFTEAQANIKVVLEDERISSACVGMSSVTDITSDVAAVLDKTKLTDADMKIFKEYAKATENTYCAGCANICDSAVPDVPCISDVMRYLMYCNSYGDHDRAKMLFARIPTNIRNKLLSTDYSLAEARCPQHLLISKLIAEAVTKLA